jgi:hypothetical protein
VCSVTSVVVVVDVVAVVVVCIYSCCYVETSYILVISLGTSQCCDNDNHDLPKDARRPVKWRDDV